MVAARRKQKGKAAVAVFLLLIVAVALSVFFIIKNDIGNRLVEKGYNKTEMALFREKLSAEQLEYLAERENLSFLYSLVSAEGFVPSNLEKYIEYIYGNNKNCDIDEVIYIVENDINYPYSEKLLAIIHDKHYLSSRLDRYMNYEDDDYSVIVPRVNANRDYEYYTNTEKADLSENLNVLVNKYYYLDKDYTPDDLVSVNPTYAYSGNSCRAEVLDAFIEMYNAARIDGIRLIINSGFRSYETQEAIWNDRNERRGQAAADSYAGRAGFSEHQTGLALDIDRYPSKNNREAYDWLAKHAYNYGFILRYPEGKEEITGYSHEAWHYRYVGKETAKIIFEEGLTLEEYYAFYIKK